MMPSAPSCAQKRSESASRREAHRGLWALLRSPGNRKEEVAEAGPPHEASEVRGDGYSHVHPLLDHGGKDLIEDGVNGLLVDADNEEHLAGAMGRVLGDRQLAAALGKNARETVTAKYDIGNIAEAYIVLYRNLLAEKRVTATDGIS